MKQLEQEYNADFTSCIGALIYLGTTCCDIVHAVSMLAEFSRRVGRTHFKVLIHLLCYLRDNSHIGIRFYNDPSQAPLVTLPQSQELQQQHPFLAFQIPRGMTMWTQVEALAASS